MDSNTRRQQLYDQIRQSSKDEFILEEMKRLGFWNKRGDAPTVPEQLIKRKRVVNLVEELMMRCLFLRIPKPHPTNSCYHPFFQ